MYLNNLIGIYLPVTYSYIIKGLFYPIAILNLTFKLHRKLSVELKICLFLILFGCLGVSYIVLDKLYVRIELALFLGFA